jgi:ligand-binding sensor domain-containing protein
MTLLVVQLNIIAQEIPYIKFKNYGVTDGLSMSTIFDIEQTPDGYLWIATADGLNRFDGYDFKVYKNISKDKFSLQENYITALEVDGKGNLWVGTNGGFLSYYDLTLEKFIRFPLNTENGKPNRSKINDIFWDNEKYIWVGTELNGLYKLDSINVQNYTTFNSSLSSNNILTLNRNVDGGDLWIGTFTGLNKLNYSQLKVSKKVLLAGGTMISIEFKGDNVLAGTQDQGMYLVKGSDYYLYDKMFSITSYLGDKRGMEWLGIYNEGIRIKQPNGGIQFLKHDPNDLYSLANDVVYKTFEDATGNIWIGTLSGLSVYRPLMHQFGYIGVNKGSIKGLKDVNVYNIYQDSKKDIWFCTYNGGISKKGAETKTIENYHTGNTKGLASNNTRVILEEGPSQYWVGTGNDGLYLFNEGNKEFKSIEVKSKDPILYIRDLKKTNDFSLWLGCENGLFLYDIEKKGFRHFKDDRLTGIYEIEYLQEENKLLLASFNSGLLVFDLANNVVEKQFVHKDSDSLSLSNNSLMCITKLKKGVYCLGTFGGGFSVFDYKKETFSNYGIKDGLSNEAIYGILLDGDAIWLSSNKGLSRFNLKNNSVNNFDISAQVQSLEFNEGAFLKSSDGTFYFGGINGVNYFKPDRLKQNHFAPRVNIQKVRIFEEDFPFKSNMTKDGLVKLKYKQNFVGFEFVAINFSNPEKCAYKYKLEGIDKDWVYTSNSRYASRYAKYINLSPGVYTFYVKAMNEDGVWTKEAQYVKIEIEAPFWQKIWFLILAGLLLAGLVIYVIFQRTKRLKRKYNVKVLDLELKALRSQMNPHFIFNSINSIQYYILNKNPKIAYNYLSKFSTLMRLILNNSRVDFISLKEEVEALSIYLDLEKMRLEDELEYIIELSDDLKMDDTLIPSMIIQPYVENAILHGLAPKEKDRKLLITMRKKENQIYCIIEDNGIGRVKAKELNSNRTRKHQSTGMKVTKGRLELLNRANFTNLSVSIKDLLNSSNEAYGTKIEIYIPFKVKGEND